MTVDATTYKYSLRKQRDTLDTGVKAASGYRIRTLLLVLLIFHMFALVAALTFMTYRQYNDEVAEQANLATAARVYSVDETEGFIEQAEVFLSKLATYSAIKALDVKNCDRLLTELQYLSYVYANLITLDKHGKLVCSAKYVPNSAASGPDPTFYFTEAARTNQFTIGKPALGFLTGEWVSSLAYPIRDAQGQFNGVVVLAIDLFRFKPFMPSKGVPNGTYSGIINSQGVMVTTSEGAEKFIGQAVVKETFEHSARLREGTFRMTDYEGRKRLVSFGPVKGTDWSLYVSLDEASVLDPIVNKGWRRLTFILVIMLILGWITRWVAKRIAQPFESVSETMVRVGAGDTYARAHVAGSVEARQIAYELNEMLDARERAVLKLKQSEERYRTAFRTIPDGIAISRLDDGLYLDVNDGFTPQSGWRRDEVIGKTSIELNIWRWPNERQKLIAAMNEHGVCTNLESEFIAKDGRIWTGVVSAQLIELDEIPCILTVTRDVTESRQSQELIHHLSFSDLLTGLPNRRLFMDRLEQVITANERQQTTGALIFVAVDDFKSINDALGHDQGDILLREVARRLNACSRPGDTVARLGGDEFVVMVPDLELNGGDGHADALNRCQHIFLELNKSYQLSHAKHHRTACIGVSLLGAESSKDAHESMQQVEIAMHCAKAAGRGKICFFKPEMQAAVDARLSLEEHLRQAIDGAQLVLHYQPQVTASGKIVGAEALMRWCHPTLGSVSPAEFIPLAEEIGLIVPLGLWALETACHQIAQWRLRPQMADLFIAVNVSARQFLHDDFVKDVQKVLQDNNIKRGSLKLEVTESVLIANPANVIARMSMLKELGVGFSLDDFGTGYSSLAYLKQLPLNQLKIDQGFVRDMLNSSSDIGIIKMIIALAESMNLNVIAEGVENEPQRKMLADLGCDTYQGYLFSRPISALEFEAFVCD